MKRTKRKRAKRFVVKQARGPYFTGGEACSKFGVSAFVGMSEKRARGWMQKGARLYELVPAKKRIDS